jgi:protein SMG8
MNEPVTSNGIVIDKKTREGSEVMRIVKGSGEGHLLLGMDLPIYMHCPHCEASAGREEKREDMIYAGCVSQLQRIFLVTPPTPLMILTTQAVVQFEDLSSSGTPKQEGHLQQGVKQEGTNVSGATEIVLPPDSFLVLRLPFVYHTVEKNGNLRPLSYQKDAPERSAWLVKGTALRLHAKVPGAVETLAWQRISR